MSDVILEMRNVSKSFSGVKVLKNADLTLHKGEILALLGENGAGKTTLMNVLGGVAKPDAGDIVASARINVGYAGEAADYPWRFTLRGSPYLSAKAESAG